MIVHHVTTGEVRNVDGPDARELIATGRWSRTESPSTALHVDIKGAVPGGGESAPCEVPPLTAEVAGGGASSGGAALTIVDLRARLKAAGVSFASSAPKADLVALFDSQCLA